MNKKRKKIICQSKKKRKKENASKVKKIKYKLLVETVCSHKKMLQRSRSNINTLNTPSIIQNYATEDDNNRGTQ
jgi:hypothetical protein